MAWTRELIGWVLIALGVAAFGVCYFEFLRYRRVFEAGPMAFVGFILFRGGIHLLKVAVAARICQTQKPEAKPRPSPVPVRETTRPEKRAARRPPRQVVSQD